MDAQGSGTGSKERWMKTALVVLSAAVVTLATVLALVAGQESATVTPGGSVDTQPGAGPTVEVSTAENASSSSEKPEAETPVAGTTAEASIAADAPSSSEDPEAETPDTATPDTAGGPSKGPVAGLSEAEHAALGELMAKFQDPERQLSETERAALVELASRLRAGAIIFQEDGDGQVMYRFYTGREYPLFVNDEGRAGIRCPERSSEAQWAIWDKRIESKRKYYGRIHRELYPDFEGNYAEFDYKHMYGREAVLVSAFYQMYGISGTWFRRNVPFIISGWSAIEILELFDDDGNYMGQGMELKVCPKVHVSDIAPESSLSMFEGVIPIQLNDWWMSAEHREGYELKDLEEIEEWWESRHGGD